MAEIELPIGGGFYQSESLPISAQRCIGWFPVIPQTEGAKTALYNTPGQNLFSTVNPVNRGAHVMSDVPFFVNQNTLYSIDSAGVATSLGAISGTGGVSMADNGTKLVIVVPNGLSYVWDGTDLTTITDPDFITSDTVVFKDGYFVFTASDGSVFFNSALNDPLNYRALDFGTAEIDPDKIVAAHVNHNELYIFGTETLELFQNIGGSGFPFQRIQGAIIQKGLHAKFGVVDLDQTFAFVGGGFNELSAIYQVLNSATAGKISTDAIDEQIQLFTKEEIADCKAISYFDRGNQIAAFTFESKRIPSRTFAYNATTSKITGIPTWFEFQSGVSDNRWNVNTVVSAYGKLLCGTTTSAISVLDKNTYTELDNTIMRQFTSITISDSEDPLFYSKIVLYLEAGVGTTTGQGSNPKVLMEFSDNAKTFGNGRTRKIGKIGAFMQETEWRRNGRSSAFRVFRFTITDPVKAVIRGLKAVVSQSGPSG